MKIHLTSAYSYHPEKNFAVKWLSESAALDPFKIYSLIDNPQEADIILFVEHHPDDDPYFFKVLNSIIYKSFRSKCLLYHDNDRVIPLIPGIYPSIERRIFCNDAMQTAHYIARLCKNEAIEFSLSRPDPEFLFSFVGASVTHPVRNQILELHHPNCFLKDTAGKSAWKLDPKEKKIFEEEFVAVCQKSQFILCPRGIGPVTYRLFEAMEMGIPPVIISDEWVPIPGPEWESFSIQIPENQTGKIPDILEEKMHLAPQMGELARRAWEEWFSKEVSFHRIAEACERLQKNGRNLRNIEKLKIYSEFLMPFHLINLLRCTKKKLLKRSGGSSAQ